MQELLTIEQQEHREAAYQLFRASLNSKKRFIYGRWWDGQELCAMAGHIRTSDNERIFCNRCKKTIK